MTSNFTGSYKQRFATVIALRKTIIGYSISTNTVIVLKLHKYYYCISTITVLVLLQY